MENIRRDDSNLRFSRQLAVIHVIAVMVITLVIGVTAVWISRTHDQLAEADTERMIAGGIAALEEQLRTITADYSLWGAAYEAIRAGDAEWIWENIGVGVAENGTTDLMIVVEPGEAVQFGWVVGMKEEPARDLLPAATIATTLRLLDDVPIDARRAVSRFARIDGQTWLLAIARVTDYDGVPDGITDQDIPRILFGLKVDNALMSKLGAQFLMDDLMIAEAPKPGQ